MKKLLLVVALMLTAGVVANAQLKFGVKAGVNMSNVAMEDEDNRVGFHAGVFGEFKISKFAIQPEVLYSFQGAKDTLTKMDINYLSVPVMLKYYIVNGLSVEAGPQLGFLLSSKVKQDGAEDVDMKEGMNKVDFAVNFGASYELAAIPVGFFARYSIGVNDMLKKEYAEVLATDAGKNRVFQIGAFVKF